MGRKIQYTIPVLSSSFCEDFPESEFEVQGSPCASEDKSLFMFDVSGRLNCLTLEKFIVENVASISVLIRCNKTRFRKVQEIDWHYVASEGGGITFSGKFSVERAALSGVLEAEAVIIARKEISDYSPQEANVDFFSGETFVVPCGFLLGKTEFGKIILDDENSQITGTDIMEIVSRPDDEVSCPMSVDYGGEIIRIELAEAKVRTRDALLANLKKTFRATICFPVLVGALSILKERKKSSDDDLMWTVVLSEKLEELSVDIEEVEDFVGLANRLLGDVCAESMDELSMFVSKEDN